MIYEVSHRTRYRYSIPVSFSHHVLHLSPRTFPHQVCHRTALSISPTPTIQTARTDYFANPETHITLQEQHSELVLHVRSVIEVRETSRPVPAETRPWDEIYGSLVSDISEPARNALQFAFELSAYTVHRGSSELRDSIFSARPACPRRRSRPNAADFPRFRLRQDGDYGMDPDR